MKANKKQVATLIKTARGQLEGILQMIDDDRYCIDVSTQLLAASSIIKKANKLVLKAHVENCIKDAIKNGQDGKIDELFTALDKL